MPDHLRKSGFPKMSPDDMLAISPSVGNPGDAFGEKKKRRQYVAKERREA